MPAKDALAAMNEALKPVLPTAESAPPTDEVEEVEPPEPEEVETPEGEETPEGAETETEETETPEAEGEEIETDETETPEAKTAREKQEALDKANPPDHINDPIPTDVTPRTQERMRFLADEVKRLAPTAAQGEELLGHIESTGMTPDEFAMALTFGKLKHSDDTADHEKAYAILWQGLKEIAPLIGRTLPGVDPLEGHADLQARVLAKTLDAKDAAELAAGRNRKAAEQAAAQRASQNRNQTQAQTQARERAEEQSRQDLNELGQNLAEVDPQFEAKMAALKAMPKGPDGLTPMQRIAKAPPQLRTNAFFKAFRAVKLPLKGGKPAAGAKPGAKPGQQPLRANRQPASGAGVKREPKTAVEAMSMRMGLAD
jgi:hypothetical protein